MPTKSDILLGDNLNLKSNLTKFSAETASKASVFVATSNDGAGLIIVHGGDSANDTNGLMIADDKGQPRILIGQNKGSTLHSTDGRTRIFMDGSSANVFLGGGGQDGDLVLRNKDGDVTAHFSGQAGYDGNGLPNNPHPSAKMKFDAGVGTYDFGGAFGGNIYVRNNSGAQTIKIYGQSGKGDFHDLEIGIGSRRISSLLSKIEELEQRIAQLEA